jgi:Holliday junction resolvase RusA-like endonuclease
VKRKYSEFMAQQLTQLPVFSKIALRLDIYPQNRRLFDIDNIASVHCKFFLDALVSAKKLEDDNYLFVPEIHTYIGTIDKDDPRVEITIKDISNGY